MHDPRATRYSAYLRTLADQMGLRDWIVLITDERDAQPGCEADVVITYGRKVAAVALHPRFYEIEPERQRVALCHELVHAHTESPWELANDGLSDELKPGFKRLMELAVDGIACAWAETLPLPPKSARSRR